MYCTNNNTQCLCTAVDLSPCVFKNVTFSLAEKGSRCIVQGNTPLVICFRYLAFLQESQPPTCSASDCKVDKGTLVGRAALVGHI